MAYRHRTYQVRLEHRLGRTVRLRLVLSPTRRRSGPVLRCIAHPMIKHMNVKTIDT